MCVDKYEVMQDRYHQQYGPRDLKYENLFPSFVKHGLAINCPGYDPRSQPGLLHKSQAGADFRTRQRNNNNNNNNKKNNNNSKYMVIITIRFRQCHKVMEDQTAKVL